MYIYIYKTIIIENLYYLYIKIKFFFESESLISIRENAKSTQGTTQFN